MRPRLHLEVANTRYPRFVIANHDEYWTGKEWSGDQCKARLYRRLEEASKDYRDLTKRFRPRTFTAHLEVTLYDGETIQAEDLRKELFASIRFMVDFENVLNTTAFVSVNLKNMRETK